MLASNTGVGPDWQRHLAMPQGAIKRALDECSISSQGTALPGNTTVLQVRQLPVHFDDDSPSAIYG